MKPKILISACLIGENVKYPAPAAENGIQGKVFVTFVVAKDGAVEKVRVAWGISPALDNEAIRVVSSMPNWIPGKQNGRNVPVFFTIPIVYRLAK